MAFRVWMPATQAIPRGSRTLPNIAWWALVRAGLFARRDLIELSIWCAGEMLHRLIVSPRWYRFPFMGAQDLQLGALWTRPDKRGHGLARAAVAEAHRLFAGRAPCFWYVVDARNQASIRLIESSGYQFAGFGHRTRPFHIRLLGQFVLDPPPP
jgi:RimJ/RimL family protein N-acetyltransferase